jgi:hypothetical protein
MLRIVLLIVVMLVGVSAVGAQDTATPTFTPTDTPTPTPTSTDVPFIHVTMIPGDGTPVGQMTRFDFTSTAGDVQIANLLTWLLYSVWGIFLFAVIVLGVLWRRSK